MAQSEFRSRLSGVVRDVYPGSWILIFIHTQIPDLTTTKEMAKQANKGKKLLLATNITKM
jgi:hypothetical protein